MSLEPWAQRLWPLNWQARGWGLLNQILRRRLGRCLVHRPSGPPQSFMTSRPPTAPAHTSSQVIAAHLDISITNHHTHALFPRSHTPLSRLSQLRLNSAFRRISAHAPLHLPPYPRRRYYPRPCAQLVTPSLPPSSFLLCRTHPLQPSATSPPSLT